MIKNIVLPVLLLLWPAQAFAQHREPDGEILLWPDAPAPGSEALIGELEEIIVERSPDPEMIRDRPTRSAADVPDRRHRLRPELSPAA